jgi:hypothetical protein
MKNNLKTRNNLDFPDTHHELSTTGIEATLELEFINTTRVTTKIRRYNRAIEEESGDEG